MVKYQNTLSSLLFTCSLGMLNCIPSAQPDKAPTYTQQFSGTVVGESLEQKFIGEDIYTFSLKTKQGLNVFSCDHNQLLAVSYCPYSPHTLDALISPGTNVTIKFPYSREADSIQFQIEDSDTIEIDGQVIND